MENLGCVTYRETGAARRPEPASQLGAAAGGHRRRPRDRPHVVWRPRDHEVVERHLAQRGLRHLHGAHGHRRLPARLGRVDRLRRRQGRRPGHRRPAATRPVESRSGPRRGGSHVRRAHLSEGGRRPSDARAVPRRGAVPPGHRPLSAPAPLRQYRDQRPVGRHRGGLGRTRPHHHGLVDLPGRLPLDQRGRSADGTPSRLPAALPLPRRERRALGGADQPARLGRRESSSAACSSTRRPPSTSTARWTGSWSTTAPGASTGSATRRPARPPHAADLQGIWTHWNASAWSAIRGRVSWRAAHLSCWVGWSEPGDEDDPDVWAAVWARSDSST